MTVSYTHLKPPPALLDGHTLPQQKGRKFVKAASLGKCLPYRPAQLRLVRFKLGGLGRLSCGFSGSVLFIKGKLPFLCRPVFPFGYPFPVSYTHLDVYKRQVLPCRQKNNRFRFPVCVTCPGVSRQGQRFHGQRFSPQTPAAE